MWERIVLCGVVGVNLVLAEKNEWSFGLELKEGRQRM